MADSYIALMSRFTTCGSWEGHYGIETDRMNRRYNDLSTDTEPTIVW